MSTFFPSTFILWGLSLLLPRNVPPWVRIPLTSGLSIGMVLSSTRPLKPSRMPTTAIP